MKIGTKQIILFVIALGLITVGFKHTEIMNYINGREVSNQTEDNDKEDEVSGASDVNGAPAGLAFSAKRLERDTARGKTKEIYENITKDSNAAEQTKSEAYKKIVELAETVENESKAESMIREKGFVDGFLWLSEKGELEVMIKTETLNEEQVVQITDVIMRYLDVEYSDIHIRKS